MVNNVESIIRIYGWDLGKGEWDYDFNTVIQVKQGRQMSSGWKKGEEN